MNDASLLSIKNLSISFGGLKVLENISLNFKSNQIVYAVIGPNGAGKSSFFNAITGLTPYTGNIQFVGKKIDHLTDVERARRGLQRTFQNIRLFNRLSVEDNLMVALSRQIPLSFVFKTKSQRKKLLESERSQINEILKSFEIESFKTHLPNELPYGIRRRVEIARALLTKPKLILLDEPAAGLNATEKKELSDMLKRTHQSDIGIVMIEHDMSFISQLCEEIFVLHDGGVLFKGTIDEVQKSKVVQEAYLGESHL
jgi:branched-chain amino acid transport system ATP-binding protein